MNRTDREWAALFRLLLKQGGDVYVSLNSDFLIDMKIETVGRKYVTFVQTFDTGGDGQTVPESVDRYERIAYQDLKGVRLDVY